MVSMAQAAKLVGVSKPTMSRAIKSGKVSATKNPNGGWEIDPAELFRAYPDTVTDGSGGVSVKQNATPKKARSETAEAAVAMARLEAEVAGLKAQLELMREQAEDIKAQRDKWQGQAETSQRLLTDMRPQRRGWFGWGKAS